MPFAEKDHAREWMKTYCHVAGIIQLLLAAFFVRMLISFGDVQFYHPAARGKGEDFPAYFDYRGLFCTTVFALLTVTAIFGGCGLVRLRPWVRRWEAAYLGVLSIGTAVGIAAELPRAWLVSENLSPLMLFFVAFAWLYVPFLFPAVVDLMAEAARPRVQKEEPVAASVGVWDASLDG